MGRNRKRRNRNPQRSFKSTLDRQQWPETATASTIAKVTPMTATYSRTTSYALCDHWQEEFTLLEGHQVYASAWTDRPWGYTSTSESLKKERTFTPDIGFYLDELWQADKTVTTGGFVPPWLEPEPQGVMVLYPWADRAAPRDIDEFVKVLDWLLAEIKAGKRIDFGCMGAHGRTGTLLASLLVRQGMPALDAIKEVRGSYCVEAIETQEQIGFIQRLGRLLNPSNNDKVGPLFRETREVTPTRSWNTAQEILDRIEDNRGWTSDDYAVRASYSDDEPGWSDARHAFGDLYDDGEYEHWLRINTAASLRPTRQELDDSCIMPPCLYPEDCNPEDGECFIKQTTGESSAQGMSRWESEGI